MNAQTQDGSLARRLEFLGITQETREILREVWPMIAAKLPVILDGFYRKMASFEEMRDHVRGQETRLKSAQGTHWERLFSGRFDANYYESVRRIGLAHVRIGLEPRWYMGGYAFVQDELLHHIGQKHRFNGPKVARVARAVQQAVMLDMELAVSVYNDKLMSDITHKSETVATAVRDFDGVMRAALSEVSAAAGTLDRTADILQTNANDAASRTAVMSGAADGTARTVQTTAAATEELSSSISEIGRQAERSLEIARIAVKDAERTNLSVRGLAEAADRIGSVSGIISDIAAQTNLLALNATIEAARAGDLGRGFAVVAQEVKTLASQTAKATEDITRQIAAIQSATQGSVADIESIAATIGEVATIATAIASAVEEQGAATREIAMNAQGAARNTADMTTALGGVQHSSVETGKAAGEVQRLSEQLGRQTADLDERVKQFFARVLAA